MTYIASRLNYWPTDCVCIKCVPDTFNYSLGNFIFSKELGTKLNQVSVVDTHSLCSLALWSSKNSSGCMTVSKKNISVTMTTLDSLFFLLQVIFSYSLTLVYYKTFIGHPPRWDQIGFFDKIFISTNFWSMISHSDS